MRSLGAPVRGAGLVFLLGLVLLSACRSVVPVPEPTTASARSDGPIRQQIVVVVHGDGNYLYHDRAGQPHHADEETLREAFAAARDLQHTELFVIHQRPQQRILGLFPRPDGTIYHFVGGGLFEQTTYDQDRTRPLAAAATWIAAHRTVPPDSSALSAVLYYGHAIPERPSPGYHHSRPDVHFGVDALSRGLERLRPSHPFDVAVLSTCDGGTPHTVTALAPHVRHLVAAPGDLHLSYIDADLLPALSTSTNAAQWARTLAERAFDRLADRTVTAVSLATYDMNLVRPIARRMGEQVPPDSSTIATGGRHVDCRRVLSEPVDTTGVRVWYRPAPFGPRADKTHHSGWACLPPSAPGE